MEPSTNQPNQPQQPFPSQPAGPQPMQNGQLISLQHAPQTPMPGAGIPDWQRGLASQVPPAPYQVEPSIDAAPGATPALATPSAAPTPIAPPAPIQPPSAPVVQAFETSDGYVMPAASATPLPETPYRPHTPVQLPGRPSPAVYTTEQLRPEPTPRPAQVWQQPPAAQSPNEISMPGPGASEYQRPAPAAASVATNISQSPTQTTHRSRRPLLIIGAVLIVLLLAAVAYFSFVRKDNTAAGKDDGLQATQVQNLRLADSATATLTPPKAIDGYKELKTGTDTVRNFIADNGKCELVIGTVSAGQLPGNTINEIIKPQLDQLRTAGASVEGPDAGAALSIKDAKDTNKSYSLDTVNYKYTQDKTQTTTHYSAAILKNGDRAVINRTCHNNGAVDENDLKKLDAAVTQITAKTTAKQ